MQNLQLQSKGFYPDECQPGQADRNTGSARTLYEYGIHKMIRCALDEVRPDTTQIVRSHTSSASALNEILSQRTAACSSI